MAGSAFDDVLGSAPAPARTGGSAFDDALGASASPAARPGSTNASPFATDEERAGEKPGHLEAFLRGIKQGATLGFGDELTGLVESIVTDKSYEKARDEARSNDKAAKEAHPWTFGAGEIGGGAATALIPGVGIAKGAGMAAQVGRAALTGAAAGLGGSEADLTHGDVGKAAADTAMGAAAGGALGFVGAKLGKFFAGAPARAEEAELAGLKQGVQNSTKVRAFGKAGANERDIIGALREEPAIRKAIASDPRAGLEKVRGKLSDLGERLDAIYDTAQANIPKDSGVPVGDVIRGMKKVEDFYRETSATKPMADQVRGAIENFKETWSGKRVPFQDLRREYRAFQDMGFEGGPMFSVPAAKQLKRDISTAMREVLQDHIEKVAEAQPDLGISKASLQALNKQASTWARIESIVAEKATREPAAAPPLGSMLQKLKHPIHAALDKAHDVGEALDTRLLGPEVSRFQRNPALARRIAMTYGGLKQGGAAAAPDLPGLTLRGVGQTLQPGAEE